MSIFTRPLAKLQSADLAQLLQDTAVENVRLEFKSNVPDKDETLKKLSSFANTFGGFMVVGAKANGADGRINELPGVDEQAGYKQKIVQWCFDAVSPPLIVEVSDAVPTPAATGKVCYVIHAAESDVAPHFLNGRRGIWVRTDEFSQRYEPRLATENEIQHLLDRRQVIQERRTELVQRARGRFKRYRSTMAAEESRTRPDASTPCLELSIGPRFPNEPICGHSKLVQSLKNFGINWRQTSFPYSSAGFISQHESVLFVSPRGAQNRPGLVEANIWGMLFYGTELEIEIGPKQTLQPERSPITGIHIYRLVGHLLVFTEHALQALSHLGYNGPLSIDVTLSCILAVPWIYTEFGSDIQVGPVSELDDGFSFSFPTTTEILKAQRDALVINMLQFVLFGMNWPDVATDPKRLEALVRSGYRYNFWNEPSELQL